MLLRLCQLKSLLLIALMLTGCSRFHSKEHPQELLSMLTPKWFLKNPAHTLHDQQGKPQIHLFFDNPPEFSKNQKVVNVIITTPENSPHAYELDLNSGQRFYSHSYCSQKDAWNQEGGSFERPPFSIGIVPHYLDQLGDPQKVIVFGGRNRIRHWLNSNYHPVKLFGAYVEQSCPEGNCLGKSNWLSRLVLLGSEMEDPLSKEVVDVASFQKRFEWSWIKANLENIDGRNGIGDQTYPAVRIGQMIELSEAMKYFNKSAIHISEQEAEKIQKGCHGLYDRLWKDVGVVRPEDRAATTVSELKAKLKLKEEMKKKGLPVGFAARFTNFTKKYWQEAATCEKFVYHGNINGDSEEFWFLSYVNLFYRINRDGYYFDCLRKSWQKNLLSNNGNLIYDLKRDVGKCSEADIDMAMDYLKNFLTGLKYSGESFYKFIDYDNNAFGTHRKMYSWVKVKGRKFDCSNDLNQKVLKEINVFPDEVDWKERSIKDVEDKMKIIY